MADTKKPSGAAFRRARAEREERDGQDVDDAAGPEDLDGDVRAMLATVGLPAFKSLGGVSYAHRAMQYMLHRVLHSTTLSFEKQIRFAKDLAAVIGMTHVKAHTDELLAELEEHDRQAEERADGHALDERPQAGGADRRSPDDEEPDPEED